MAWTGKTFNIGAILTASDMNNLQADIAAQANGDTGAPKNQTASYDTGSVDQAAIGANAVGQSEVKETTGTVSTTAAQASFTMAGGAYSFFPQIKTSNASGAAYLFPSSAITVSLSYDTTVNIGNGGGHTTTLQSTYITASPPYDLGDGEVPLFVFAVVDNTAGDVESVYVAPEAPWHYNGKTSIIASRKDLATGRSWKKVKAIKAELMADKMDIRNAILAKRFTYDQLADRLMNDEMVEIEITQDIKNADMVDIPHPFMGNALTGKTVIMLDPVSTEKLLALHDDGENINELLHNGTIKINNSPIIRATPQGVQAYGFTL